MALASAETTLERSLDYLVRVSDKAHYVSPSRGQLGNALKCVWAAPYVMSRASERRRGGGDRQGGSIRLTWSLIIWRSNPS